VSFGGGVHMCLGAAMARVEGAVVLRRLLARFSEIEADGEPTWSPSAGGFRFPYWSFDSVPVTVRPSAGPSPGR
jgi:cytochrome P450